MKTYLRHRSLNVIDVKGLVALEYLDFEGKYKDYSETHDFCEICYVEEGEISLILENEEKKLVKDELIFIEPNTRHSYFSKDGNNSHAFVVCFECFSQTLKPLSGIKLTLGSAEKYCMERIIAEKDGTYRTNDKDQLELIPSPSFGGQQAIILQLESLLIGLLRKLSADKNAGIVFLNGDNFYPDLVEIIKGYLQNNIRRKISLGDVCAKFNYSRSFICRIFKEETGETLITYFNRVKIEEAKNLLINTENTVTEISEMLGFSEVKYFGVIFKKQVGKSPAAYRAAMIADNK